MRDDLVFIVWLNPDHPKKPQSRLLMTHFSANSDIPRAFPLEELQNSAIFANLPVQNPHTIAEALLDATQARPILISTDLAAAQLGWTEFEVSTDHFGA